MKGEAVFTGSLERSLSMLAELSLPPLDPRFLHALPADAPGRWSEFLPVAYWLIATLRPAEICSLRRLPDVSYAALCQTVAWIGLNAQCHAIRPFEKTIEVEAFRAIHDENFGAFSTLLESSEGLAAISSPIAAGSLGLLNVDMGLGARAADRIVESLSAKFADNAVVLVHGSKRRFRDLNARLQWKELTSRYPHFEFTQGDGVGVIAVGAQAPPSIVELCSQIDEATSRRVQHCLVSMGAHCKQAADEETPAPAASGSAFSGSAFSMTEDIKALHRDLATWRRKSSEAERSRADIALRLNAARRDVYAANLRAEQAIAEGASLAQHAMLERQAILSSRTWRVTRPFRQLAERHPRVARLTWRTMCLLWWCVSLQLLARYRERRNHLPAAAAPQFAPGPSEILPPTKSPGANDIARAGHPLSDADALAESTLQAGVDYAAFLSSGRRLEFESSQSPQLSIIIALNGNPAFAFRSLESLQLQKHAPPFEVLALRETSRDTLEDLLSRTDSVRVLPVPAEWSPLQAFNKAAEWARGRALLFVDADTSLDTGALAAALTTLESAPDIGAVGGRLLAPSGRVRAAGGIIWSDCSLDCYGLGLDSKAGEVMFRREVDFSPTPLLVARAAWQQLERYDSAFGAATYGQADFAIRLREAGWRLVYEPRFVATFCQDSSHPNIPSDAFTATRRSQSRLQELHGSKLRLERLPPPAAEILVARERRSVDQRRLLMIDSEVPFAALGAGYPRAKEILTVAAAAGWSVTLYPFRRPQFDWDAALAEFPPSLEIVPDLGVAGLPTFLKRRRGFYDVVLISRPDNMELVQRIFNEDPEALGGARLVYDAEAVFATRDIIKARLDGQPFSAEREDELCRAEAQLTAGADAITCVTESEAEFFRLRSPASVYVVNHPLSAAVEGPDFAGRKGFLFVGRLLEHAAPNWQGLSWFVRECWPLIRAALPSATLTVAGHLHADHAALEAPGIRLLGAVPNLADCYDSARVFIAPIQFAAGVSIKILEATAAGLPVAATRLMAHQLGWQPGLEIIAEDDAQALAAGCVTLHEDVDFWRSMRTAAGVKLQSEYGPEQFRKNLEAALQ